MTFSDATYNRALEILRQVTALLDEDVIAQHVDEPIDEVLEKFGLVDDWAWSHQGFHRTIAEFVRHLYEKAIPCMRELSLAQAHDESIALLEQGYRQMGGSGYDHAVLDAADPSQSGLRVVLAAIAEGLKEHERETYLRWVLARHIDPADWHTKCAIAAILTERCREWVPPELCRLSPEQLADSIPELLAIDLATGDHLETFPTDSACSR